MSGTDLDIAVSLRVPADVEEQGALTVPAKGFQELARELPEQPVRVATKVLSGDSWLKPLRIGSRKQRSTRRCRLAFHPSADPG